MLPLVVSVLLALTSQCHGGGSSSWPSGIDTYMSESWAVLSRIPQPSCVDIPRNFTLCHGIDYNRMRIPNLVDHETLDEAVQQAAPWLSLLRLNCHSDTQRFLCSLFAPVCLERAIYPCRSLCETVKAGCEKRMQMYGFPWPEMLNCKKFPVANDMCIRPHDNFQPANKSCPACNQVGTYENILDHFCRSDAVLKVKLKSVGSNSIVVQVARAIKPRDATAIPTGTTRQLRKKPTLPLPGSDDRKAEEHEELTLVLNDKTDHPCPCPVAKGHKSNKRFLAMANVGRHGSLALNLLLPWRKEKQFKKALRMFRKLDCKTLGTQIRDKARKERKKKQKNKQKKLDKAGAQS